MPVEIRVPSMGESIIEATVVRWLKKEGETFATGDELVELETDKANNSFEAEYGGVLEKIVRQAGETVRVNDVASVAGFVLPGMRVDVLVTGRPPTSDGDMTSTVLQNMLVLSAGTTIQADARG